jgi:hypothetical protein
MSETGEEPLNALIRSLREQIARRDERIETLETMLRETNRRFREQQCLLEQAERSVAEQGEKIAAQQSALLAAEQSVKHASHRLIAAESSVRQASQRLMEIERLASVAPPVSAPAALPPLPMEPSPVSSAETTLRLPLRDLVSFQPENHLLAEPVSASPLVTAFAGSERESLKTDTPEEEREITARLDRRQLHRAHAAMEPGRKSFWPWKTRREVS